MYRKVFQCNRYTWLHNSFFRRRGRITKPLSSLSFICTVFCLVVYQLKQAGSLKSGILLLARFHQRWLLYR
jgi:hypothetical protein